MQSYSQNNEQQHILAAFPTGYFGRFLDIGAADGKNLSNTYALAERGFSGVCVEPSPPMFTKLMATHKENPRISLVCAAVSGTSRLAHFEACDEFVSSLNDTDHQKKDTQMWADSGIAFQPIHVPTVTITDLFKTFGSAYDFISIDTEGHDLIILEAILSETGLRGTKCVCVEYRAHTLTEILARLTSAGFSEVYRSGENLVMTA